MQNSNQYKNFPTLTERLVSATTYVTYGLTGLIWLILVALKKVKLTPFLQYHIFQSFFVIMLLWLLQVFANLIAQILSFIPFINILVIKILFFFNTPRFFEKYSLISSIIILFITYLAVSALRGRSSYIPWVSKIIYKNIRH